MTRTKLFFFGLLAGAFARIERWAAEGYRLTNRCPDCGRLRTGPACVD
jgi:hypothetical protein